MGQAKQRGTYEQRKAAAQKEIIAVAQESDIERKTKRLESLSPSSHRRIMAIAALLALSGCAVLAGPNASVEAMAQAVKDKNLTAGCISYVGAGGTLTATVLNQDQGVVPRASSSSSTIEPNCKTTINVTAPAPAPKP